MQLPTKSRPGLLLLGENNLYWLAQNPEHTLNEPERIAYSGTAKSAQILDIDGDGRDDLLVVNWDSPNPFRFRLQGASHQSQAQKKGCRFHNCAR